MCSQCEKGGTVERKFIEEVRALSGDVEDPVQEDVTVEVKTSGTQVERVLAPDSEESSSLLEQISVLQGNEEKLRDAHRFIDMLKEENARHLTKISSLMGMVNRKEGAKKQMLARIQELAEELRKAKDEIRRLSSEVNLDIPAMMKEIETLKSNLQSEMAFNHQSTKEIERLNKTLEGRERAITHRDECFKKVAGRNGELVKEVEDLKTKLKDCEKQRDEAEKGYGEREALAGEIHRLRREREDMILWGKQTWKTVEAQGLEIAKFRQELKTQQNTLGELEVAEVQYLTTIRDLEARLKFTEERMENFKDLWVQATEGNNKTPASSPITTPDAPLRRSSSVPLPSRCLFPDKRSREDEEEEDKDKSPRSKKQLKF